MQKGFDVPSDLPRIEDNPSISLCSHEVPQSYNQLLGLQKYRTCYFHFKFASDMNHYKNSRKKIDKLKCRTQFSVTL